MDSMSLTSGVTLRLYAVGIPTHSINPFTGLILRWVTCSGEEWTVKRLKSLKQLLIHKRSGIQDAYPLARNRRGEYKGVVGYLLRWALKSDDNFSKVINAFMAYTHWTSVKLTKDQRNKFQTATNAAPPVIPEPLKDLIQRSVKQVTRIRTVRQKPIPLLLWRGSRDKRAPTLLGSRNQDSFLLSELLLTRQADTYLHIKSLWEPIYQWVFKGINIQQLWEELEDGAWVGGDMAAGEVHFLQEPGYKLRSIASPYRLFQVASEPLKNDLKYLISQLEWDCTHDQGRAFSPIQEAIRQGKKVHSVDLSSATDYFPLDLQLIVLQTIYGTDSPYVKLFRDVSRGIF